VITAVHCFIKGRSVIGVGVGCFGWVVDFGGGGTQHPRRDGHVFLVRGAQRGGGRGGGDRHPPG
jgi:hypothetical protein